MAVEAVDVVGVVAGVEGAELATTEVEGQAADSGDVNVDGLTISSTIEVVAVELRTAFEEEVYIFAQTEVQLQAGTYGQCPALVFDGVIFVIDIGCGSLDVPYICATEAYEGYDGECTVGVDTADAVEHVPHEVEVGVHVLGLRYFAVVPAHCAAQEADTPAQVRGEPFAETEVVYGCDFVLGIGPGQIVFYERTLYTCTDLYEPVVTRCAIVVCLAGLIQRYCYFLCLLCDSGYRTECCAD